jgi:hypothetical protein
VEGLISKTDNIMKQIFGISGAIFFTIGSLSALAAVACLIFTCHVALTASRAEGTVIRLLPGSKPIETRGGGGTHPLVRFVPAGARNAVEFSGGGLNYVVGDRVTVLYHNSYASIDDPVSLWSSSIGAGIFSVIFTTIGYKHMQLSRRL